MCRSSDGKILKAALQKIEAVNVPALAKCLAIRWALEMAKEWGFKDIDCQQASSEFKDPIASSPLFGVLSDVRDLGRGMEEFSLSFALTKWPTTLQKNFAPLIFLFGLVLFHPK